MSGFAFGAPQTTAANTGFAFGAPNTQQAAPTQQPVAPLAFGNVAPTSIQAAPIALPAAAAAPIAAVAATTTNTASGLATFGVSAPPYGAQQTTTLAAVAAPSLTFGLGTAATTKYAIRSIYIVCIFFLILVLN